MARVDHFQYLLDLLKERLFEVFIAFVQYQMLETAQGRFTAVLVEEVNEGERGCDQDVYA